MYRPQFEAALRLLARISLDLDKAGYRPPVLVGGGAVEVYTSGAITTGDFDLSCGRQDVLEEAKQKRGFIRPSGPGGFIQSSRLALKSSVIRCWMGWLTGPWCVLWNSAMTVLSR